MIEQINVGVIGTGWCGGIRTKACSDNPLVDKLFIAEINDARRKEVAEQYDVHESVSDWQKLILNPEIDTIIESNINELVKILSNFEANSTLTLLKPILTNKSLVKWRSGFDSLPSSDFSQSVKIHPL